MEQEELSALVLNSIRDSRVVIDNYEYFRGRDNAGLWKQHNDASDYLLTMELYLSEKKPETLEGIRDTLARYYEPYVETFSEASPKIPRAKRFGKIFAGLTAFGFAIGCFDPNFFYCTIPVGIISLSAFGYARSLRRARAAFLHQFRMLDSEAKGITSGQLEDVLGSNREEIEAALVLDYTYGKA